MLSVNYICATSNHKMPITNTNRHNKTTLPVTLARIVLISALVVIDSSLLIIMTFFFVYVSFFIRPKKCFFLHLFFFGKIDARLFAWSPYPSSKIGLDVGVLRLSLLAMCVFMIQCHILYTEICTS